ncbi:MAG: BA14K family protein, partial [Hyphomicrobiales bacterium]|nr:BA14K family protein [Hyphomicrobiales bacterium]
PEPQYKAPPVHVAVPAPASAPKADAHLSPIQPTVSAPQPAASAPPAVVSASPPAAPAAPVRSAVTSAPPPAPAAPIAATPGPDQATAAAVVAPLPPPAPPACDVQACAAAYRSFNAADCTYQPFDGPRRLCTKGTPPAKPAGSAALPGVDTRAGAAQAQVPACHVAACEAAYRTFDPADCTYQPSDGPRRLCTK